MFKFLDLKANSRKEENYRYINNEPSRPSITKNRQEIFKKYNYQFKVLKYKSVAS